MGRGDIRLAPMLQTTGRAAQRAVKERLVRDPQDRPGIPPEAVGQEPARRGSSRGGVWGFIAANLLVWSLVIVVALVFLIILIWFAATN